MMQTRLEKLATAQEALEGLNKVLRDMEAEGHDVGSARNRTLALWCDVFDISETMKASPWRIREVSPSGDSRVLAGSYASRSDALDGVLTLINEGHIPEGYEVQVFTL